MKEVTRLERLGGLVHVKGDFGQASNVDNVTTSHAGTVYLLPTACNQTACNQTACNQTACNQTAIGCN